MRRHIKGNESPFYVVSILGHIVDHNANARHFRINTQMLYVQKFDEPINKVIFLNLTHAKLPLIAFNSVIGY